MFEYLCDSDHVSHSDTPLDFCMKLGVDHNGDEVMCCAEVSLIGSNVQLRITSH
jgi:hypothetical protein